MKILAFTFTKDRPMQLDALLRSIKKNAVQLFRPIILYKASEPKYQAGYDLVRRSKELECLDSKWINENKPLREHFINVLNYSQSKNDLFAFFTDDCLIYDKVNLTDKQIIDDCMDDRVLCLSLRLGLNTLMQDYTKKIYQSALRNEDIEYNGMFLKWEWKKYDPNSNYGYVSGQDGCIYRATDYLEFIEDWNFQTFRQLEGGLANEPRRSKIKRPMLSSLSYSKVVNIPANSVQIDPTLSGQFHSYSLDELNTRYLNGEVIDIDKMNFTNIIGAHQEIPYLFKPIEDTGV